jgi:hypothetical protein
MTPLDFPAPRHVQIDLALFMRRAITRGVARLPTPSSRVADPSTLDRIQLDDIGLDRYTTLLTGAALSTYGPSPGHEVSRQAVIASWPPRVTQRVFARGLAEMHGPVGGGQMDMAGPDRS